MINGTQILEDAPVVCSNNGQFATVDHMEGNYTIKLKKDKKGQHHYIPLSWVKKVEDKVYIDRPGEQAMREWSTTPQVISLSDKKSRDEKKVVDPIARERATNEGMAQRP